jgi:hypothetical protein
MSSPIGLDLAEPALATAAPLSLSRCAKITPAPATARRDAKGQAAASFDSSASKELKKMSLRRPTDVVFSRPCLISLQIVETPKPVISEA